MKKIVVYVQTNSCVRGRLIYQAVLTCFKKDLLICVHRDYNCMQTSSSMINQGLKLSRGSQGFW